MKAIEYGAEILLRHVKPGDHVIDATLGNGHDTANLARMIGRHGILDGFDIQPEALEATRERLRGAGVAWEDIRLWQCGHERMEEVVARDTGRRISAIVFNLGYLPGSGDKAIVTRSETTLMALDQAARLLSPGGVLNVTCYPGHEGGRQEAERVKEWFLNLPTGRIRGNGQSEGSGIWELTEIVNPGNYRRPRPFLLSGEKLA